MGEDDALRRSADEEQRRLNELRAQFTEDQDHRYQKHIGHRQANEERISDQFRVFVAFTILKDLTPRDEAHDVKEFARRETGAALNGFGDNAFRIQSPSELPKQSLIEDRALPAPGDARAASGHDYSALGRTHEQVGEARQQNSGAEPPYFSQDQLAAMQQRFEAFRCAETLPHPSSEKSELRKLVGEQQAERQQVAELQTIEAPATVPNPLHANELKLIDHQHLAERVGSEARWIAALLRDRDPVAAEVYKTGSRQAFETARQVHADRQHLRESIEQGLPAHVREERDKKSIEQEAGKVGKQLTTDQRSNLSPAAPKAVDARGIGPEKTALSESDRLSPQRPRHRSGREGGRQG